MRCYTYILNLIMGDGIREVDTSIAKVLEAMRYVKSSPNRNQTFMGFVERLGIQSKYVFGFCVLRVMFSTFFFS